MKNSEVATAFYNGEIKSTKNLFIEEENEVLIVFSYGYHFPISIKFKDGFLFNKDSYSSTTARHKNLILREIEHDLNENDFLTTEDMIKVYNTIKYNGLKSKSEYIESKI